MYRPAAFFWAACLSSVAQAGAFLQPPEQGQVIAQLGFSEAGRGYDAFGRATPIPAWRKLELSTYGEYGLTDWLTVIGEPSWFSFRSKPPGESRTRPGAAQAGARVRIYGEGDQVFSAQATVRYAVGGRGAAPYVEIGGRAQADVRLLYGRKIELFGWTGYTDVQIGWRGRGPFGHQLRFDGTMAIRPLDRTTLMVQSFTAITPGRLGARFALSQKLQASVVYDVTDAISVQAGAMIALRGVNASAERGLVSAMWYRF